MIRSTTIGLLCGLAFAFINDNRFISTQRRELKSRGLVAEELTHRVTKAKLVILSPSISESGISDRERGFAVTFRTPALDDTGVTHILEHSVFEGSKKYPVMNSISHFDRSSMATFVNAMTAPESTMYPVATVDKTDLLNLASVYLDGVFDPLILTNRTGFDREGWHYQFDERTQRLSYGGVVYNEMKGVYSNPRSLISRTIRRVLYENSTLGLESGGHPEKIPTLSYDYAIKYYMLHYHPANAYFYYYGPQSDFAVRSSPSAAESSGYGPSDSPVGKKLLDMIDWYTTMAQTRFQRKYNNLGQWTQNITSIVLPQLPSNQPVSPGSSDSTESPVLLREIFQKIPSSNTKTTLRIDSLIDLSQNFSPCELQAIAVLNTLFCSSKESPLHQRLEREQIGETISGVSISTGYPAIQFALQIDGVDPELLGASNSTIGGSSYASSLTERMLSLISEEVDRAQFSPARVYSVIKRIEISLRAEMTTQAGHAMDLFDEIVDPWLYADNPLHLLDRVENLNCVKELYMNNTSYFVDLLQNRIHPVEPRNRYGRKIVVMRAEGDPSASTRLEELEQTKLDQLKESFSADELRQISLYAQSLENGVNAGDRPEDVATLPTLSPKNIVREVDPDSYIISALEAGAGASNEEVRGATHRTLKTHPAAERFTEWMLQNGGGEAPAFRSLESASNTPDLVSTTGLTWSSDMWLKAAQMMMSQQLQQQQSVGPTRNMPAHMQLVEAVIPRGRPLSLNEAALGVVLRETQKLRKAPQIDHRKRDAGVTQTGHPRTELAIGADETPLFLYPGTTGGLVFITLHFDLNHLHLEELSQIAIVNHLLNHGYVSDLDPSTLRETLDTFTGGGISLDWQVKDARQVNHSDDPEGNKVSDNGAGSVMGTLSFRCLLADLELCMGFVERFVLAPNLANNTENAVIVANWLRREINLREQSGLKNPNSLASTRVRSKYNVKTRLAEMLEGVELADLVYKPWLDKLKESSDDKSSIWRNELGPKLEALLRKMLIKENIAVQLTAERDTFPIIRERLLRLITRMPSDRRLGGSCWSLADGRTDRPAVWRSEITLGSVGISREDEADKIDASVIATDELLDNIADQTQNPWSPLDNDIEIIEFDLRVNFNYWLLKLQAPGDDSRIPYSLYARILTNKFLTPRVRMVGGAYGVWSTYAYHDGYLVFGSYRDPHRARTYNEYALAAKAFSVEPSDLDGFIIRFIADMDKPVSVLDRSDREFNRWADGLTQAQRQKYRDDILNASIEQSAEFQQALIDAMQCEETPVGDSAGEDGTSEAGEVKREAFDEGRGAHNFSQMLSCSGGIKVSVGGRKAS